MIKVMISKAGKLADGTVAPLTANLTSVAAVMAQALKDTAFDNPKRLEFDTKRRTHLSDEYMRLLGAKWSNKETFRPFAEAEKKQRKPILRLGEKGWSWKDSATWHWITRKDDSSFNRTGGMWAGLRVRNYGAKGAVIEFAGQSEGQTGVWRKGRGRRNTSKRVSWKLSKRVPNVLKAWTVFEEKKFLLVEPDKKTQQAFESAIEAWAAKWTAGNFGSEMKLNSATGGPLRVRFLDALG